MSDNKCCDGKCCKMGNNGGQNPLYGIGLVGALVYFLQQADGFWPVIVGIFKAVLWPGFVVYDLLKFLQ